MVRSVHQIGDQELHIHFSLLFLRSSVILNTNARLLRISPDVRELIQVCPKELRLQKDQKYMSIQSSR
jgi:hypothetical protein